jgi:hypothetical protein
VSWRALAALLLLAGSGCASCGAGVSAFCKGKCPSFATSEAQFRQSAVDELVERGTCRGRVFEVCADGSRKLMTPGLCGPDLHFDPMGELVYTRQGCEQTTVVYGRSLDCTAARKEDLCVSALAELRLTGFAVQEFTIGSGLLDGREITKKARAAASWGAHELRLGSLAVELSADLVEGTSSFILVALRSGLNGPEVSFDGAPPAAAVRSRCGPGICRLRVGSTEVQVTPVFERKP